MSHIDMNRPWIYMSSPSWSHFPPPSPFLPSGFSQCTSPEHLSHASNLGWRSVSYLIIYMFHLLWLGSSFLGRVSEKARFALISSRYLSASYMSDVFKHSVTLILREACKYQSGEFACHHIAHFCTPFVILTIILTVTSVNWEWSLSFWCKAIFSWECHLPPHNWTCLSTCPGTVRHADNHDLPVGQVPDKRPRKDG